MFYDNLRAVCNEKGTTPTAVLRELNLSTSATGRWKSGSSPNLDIVCKIAEYLNVSLDYLVHGFGSGDPPEIPGIDPNFDGIMFYNSLKRACKSRGTGLTSVLRKLDLDEDYIPAWKSGTSPGLDVVCKIASYLDLSIDYLVTGPTIESISDSVALDPEWIDIITHIPEEKQKMCKDFLRTHMVIPDKYEDRKRG